MAASSDLHSVAVLGSAGDRLVIWHVNVGMALGESRLSGAWVLERSRDVEIESLTARFPVVPTDDVRVEEAAGVVDLEATVETVRGAVESADQKFDEQDAAGGKFVRPRWPVVVSPTEVSLTDSQVDVVDDHIRPVLTLARGLADLADAWAAFESLRLARGFLVELGGPVARPLPLAVR
ncbi:hypothetical protein [Nocardia concava]|uniref:hypothetical protein n=1 Tax=Nocardia concava TaxID=257281 RepID=UPI00031F2BD8|nr:hypothetical protein [Nocardia concava]